MKQSTKYLKIFCNLLSAVVVALLLVFVVPKILGYFAPFVFGFVLSLIANPLVRFLEKKIKIKRAFGSVIMIVGVIEVLVLICYGAISVIANGLSNFAAYLPTMYESAGDEVNQATKQLEFLLDRIPMVQDVDFGEIGTTLSNYLNTFMSGTQGSPIIAIGDIVQRIPDILVGLIMGLMATYFFIADRDKLIAMLEKHLPQSFRENTARIWNQIVKAVGGYFKAQFKIMFIIYIVLWIGLAILGVNYAWLIGFGIAFLDMLPVFGTGAVLWPWALIKVLTGDYTTAIGMMVLYAVAQLVHQVIQPKLVGDSVGLNPFAALVFMYIGYKVNSVVGMIVAIPTGMILINLYEVGAFDTLIWCVKEIAKDFNEFRKIPKESDLID